MKQLLALFLLLGCLPSRAIIVTINWSDFTVSAYTNRAVTLKPDGINTNGGFITSLDTRDGLTSSSGAVSWTNVTPNGYTAVLTGPKVNTQIHFTITNGTPTNFSGVVGVDFPLTTYSTNAGASTAYSVLSANGKFLTKTSLTASTGIVLITNSDTSITLQSTGGGTNILPLTNTFTGPNTFSNAVAITGLFQAGAVGPGAGPGAFVGATTFGASDATGNGILLTGGALLPDFRVLHTQSIGTNTNPWHNGWFDNLFLGGTNLTSLFGSGSGLPAGTPAQLVLYNAASNGAAVTMQKDGSLDTNGNLTLANNSTARGDLGLGSAATQSATNFATNFSDARTMFVSPAGNDATAALGRIDLPWKTFQSAATSYSNKAALLIHCLPGDYTGYDLTVPNLRVYLEAGASLAADDVNTSVALFTDEPGASTSNLRDLTNIIFGRGWLKQTNSIFGYFVSTNSSLSVECLRADGNLSSGANFFSFNPNDVVFISHTNKFGSRFHLRADLLNQLNFWLGEGQSDITADIFTNCFFYCDRDSTNYALPIHISGGIAANCSLVCQRPYNSSVIIDVPIWQGMLAANASYSFPGTAFGLGLPALASFSGEVICRGVTFMQITNGGSLFQVGYETWAGNFGVQDTNHVGRITFNDCNVLAQPTNGYLLVAQAHDAGPAPLQPYGRVLFNGTFNAYNGTFDPNVIIDGSGIYNTNANFLTNHIFTAQ